MEGQRHNNPLTRVVFVYNGPKGMELAPIIVEVAKALGGSFKLVTIAPRTVREMMAWYGIVEFNVPLDTV